MLGGIDMKKYFLKYKGLLLINFLAIALSAFANVYLAFVLKSIVDVGTSGTVNQLLISMLYSLGYVGICMLIDYMRRYLESVYIKKTLLYTKGEIFSKVLGKNIRSFNSTNSAQYISTLTNDITILEQDYFLNLLQIFYYIVSFLIGTIAIISLSIYITISIFIIGFIPVLIPILLGNKIASIKKVYSDNLSLFTSKVKDIFSGFEVIKCFNIEDRIKNEYDSSNYKVEHSKYKFSLLSYFSQILSEVFGFLMFFAALGLGTYFVIKGTFTIGSMIAAVQLMNNIVNPILNLAERLNKLQSVKLIGKKIMDIVKEEDKIDEGIRKDVFTDDIKFNNVDFSYTPDRKALNGISLKIKKGLKYAVVGGSGCGKSTILKLLLRYYEDFDGSINIDGVDNRNINIADLYSLISVIQQNVFMFDSSIKENITLFHDYSSANIDRVIKLSGLETLIKSLPNGIESSVGENGNNLSGGEKQRIAIARALIKSTPILILDEATSALDNETAYNIEKSLLSVDELTSIVVTHKLIDDILRKYDGIIVMKNGKVAETGTFDELMNKKQYFYSLYNVTGEDKELLKAIW
jgi:ATP-binding cassette subfamily C protein